MKSHQDEIAEEVARIRDNNVKDELRIVPCIIKKCMSPCGAGYCNCIPTVSGRFAVVTEGYYEYCLADYNAEIGWLQNCLNSKA